MVLSHTVRGVGLREGAFGAALGELAAKMADVSFGSYPYFSAEGYGAHLVARGTDPAQMAKALEALVDLVKQQGVTPEIDPPNA